MMSHESPPQTNRSPLSMCHDSGISRISAGRLLDPSREDAYLQPQVRGTRSCLGTCVLRDRVAVTSKTDTDGKLYTKSEKIEKEKARSSSDGEVLASSGSKVLFRR